MIQGIYQSAAAADGLQTWNDVIARNIAASTTPGFKADTVTFDGVAVAMRTFGNDPAKPIEQTVTAPMARDGISFQAGDMRRSEDPFEFAIEGQGFFRLQRPDGEFVYTRDGQFHVAPDGQLVSKQGFPVIGDGGTIQVLIDGGPISVDAEGRVRQGDQEIGAFTVYDIADHTAFNRTVGGFAIDPNRAQIPQPVEGARIQQGYLEMSNVSSVREMVNLIAVSNALQANQRVIQSYDTAMERAVQQLGTTSA